MGRTRVPWPLVAALAVCLALLMAPGVARADGDGGAQDGGQELVVSSLDELPGKKIGMVNGGAFDTLTMRAGYDVDDKDFYRFNSNSEVIGALGMGKVDVMVTDKPIANLAVSKQDGLAIVPGVIVEDHYGFALRKNSPLTDEVNRRLEEMRDDGTLERLYEKWTGADDAAKTMPELSGDAPNGTLTVVTNGDTEPMTYVSGDDVIGMCPEVMSVIVNDMGYRLEYRLCNTASMMAELESGKADIAMSCLSITDERKEKVDMTVPFYDGGVVALTRIKGGAQSEQGFFAGLADSFTRTFVTEGRWKLILGGLGVTLGISVAAGFLGYALGYGIVLLRRRGNRVATTILNGYQELMGGLPIVVVLMVLYYVIFGAFDIPGVIVAIVGFTMVFGASVGNIMWNAVCAVDIGQTEAGRALGFSDKETFSLVVLPQAARRFLPLVRGQFVSMVKDTSVVGFIAVQDLTRAGDLIRARTMEAFFPLIAIAIIYFVLCRFLATWLDRWIAKSDPANGPRTIKGVEL